eukprot:1281895-Rhodomonas_salina.1
MGRPPLTVVTLWLCRQRSEQAGLSGKPLILIVITEYPGTGSFKFVETRCTRRFSSLSVNNGSGFAIRPRVKGQHRPCSTKLVCTTRHLDLLRIDFSEGGALQRGVVPRENEDRLRLGFGRLGPSGSSCGTRVACTTRERLLTARDLGTRSSNRRALVAVKRSQLRRTKRTRVLVLKCASTPSQLRICTTINLAQQWNDSDSLYQPWWARIFYNIIIVVSGILEPQKAYPGHPRLSVGDRFWRETAGPGPRSRCRSSTLSVTGAEIRKRSRHLGQSGECEWDAQSECWHWWRH